jgi:hypothetical protein
MFTRLRNLLQRLRRGTPTNTVTIGPAPPPRPNDPILDGTARQRTRSINGVLLSTIYATQQQLTHESGLVTEHDDRGLALTGDGTLTRSLDTGFARCDVCWAELAPAVQTGELPQDIAIVQALCRLDAMQRSELSGIALCPRHTTRFDPGDGSEPIVVSTHEAAQIETDRQLQRPLLAVRNLFIEMDDHDA